MASIVEKSHTLNEIFNKVGEIAGTDLPILLDGETGTGKNYVARLLHSEHHGDGLFLTLDCAALNPNLVESELFGHEKGAFTGATETKSGMFELACGGTILLDEVQNLTPEVQAKLLRVLDEKTFRRLGGTEEMNGYFQLISTINVDVDALLQAGTLRKDLYYRIASVAFRLPPLRERPDEIPLFAEHFLALIREEYAQKFTLSKSAMTFLQGYPWPGNIREMKHAMLAATRFAKTSRLERADFEPILLRFRDGGPAETSLQSLADVEKAHIHRVLKRTGYKIARSAGILGIAENTLRSKMRKYGLTRSD